jgi:hypothetical protein
MSRIVSLTVVAAAVVLGLDVTLNAQAPPKKDGAALLAQLKGLAGDWVSAKEDDTKGKVLLSYRVTAGGSTVIETEFPGTPMEMVSVYHLDGKELVMTHFCMLKNQPRFRARAGDKDGVIHLEFTGGSNIDPKKDHHVYRGQVEIVSKDRLNSKWWMRGGHDKPHAEEVSLELVRKK